MTSPPTPPSSKVEGMSPGYGCYLQLNNAYPKDIGYFLQPRIGKNMSKVPS